MNTKSKMTSRKRMCFSLDLFNVFSEIILSGLEVLARFIIGRHNLNNISYAEYTVLMVDSQRKLKESKLCTDIIFT